MQTENKYKTDTQHRGANASYVLNTVVCPNFSSAVLSQTQCRRHTYNESNRCLDRIMQNQVIWELETYFVVIWLFQWLRLFWVIFNSVLVLATKRQTVHSAEPLFLSPAISVGQHSIHSCSGSLAYPPVCWLTSGLLCQLASFWARCGPSPGQRAPPLCLPVLHLLLVSVDAAVYISTLVRPSLPQKPVIPCTFVMSHINECTFLLQLVLLLHAAEVRVRVSTPAPCLEFASSPCVVWGFPQGSPVFPPHSPKTC